ncbi:MAG: TetR/AcrR family transcriptional regulator [Paucibacter sp.]|nr:TetR/AcrR family transcriptional regulator [Roseateles sp.]
MSTARSRKELSHERIVEAAARAIRRSGYHGVGVADIMKEAGLTHGGFYAHFESREQMLVEAMQRAGRVGTGLMAEHIAAQEARGENPFAALVNGYLSDEQLDNIDCGCIVAALSSEMPRQGEAVRDEARLRVLSLIQAVRGALPAGADNAEADAIAATLVGALQLARTLGGQAGKSLLTRTRKFLLSSQVSG